MRTIPGLALGALTLALSLSLAGCGDKKEGDKAAIEAKTEALARASQKLGEKIYGDAQGAAGAGGASGASGAAGGPAGPGAGGGEAKKDDSDVVDAEFTEVKDKKG